MITNPAAELRFYRSDTWQLAATSSVLCKDLYAKDQHYDWITYTPDGYFHASPGADDYLLWRIDGKLVKDPVLTKRFRRPDLVRTALGTARQESVEDARE